MATREEYIEGLIDREVAPYAEALEPATMKQLRCLLRDLYTTHPVMNQIVGEGAPDDRAGDASKEVPKDVTAAAIDASKKDAKHG